MSINPKEIKELIKIIESSDHVNKLKVSYGEGKSIEIDCGPNMVAAPIAQTASITHAAPQAAPATQASQPASQPKNISDNQSPTSEKIEGFQVKSPMVGTYYSSPSPDAPAFITTGQKVKKGDTLCIIEAMKMMNQIEAEKSGTIKAILVENSDPIEFDQVIIIID